MQDNNKNEQANKRVFPRLAAQCPVMHRASDQQRWSVGVLINFSATGFLFSSARALAPGEPITVRLERGRNRSLPALSGSGKVARCNKMDSGKYEVACKLDRIDLPSAADS